MPNLISFADLDWEPLGAFARQKTVTVGDQAIRVLELSPGFKEHDWCSNRHVIHVVRGELEIAFRDRTEKFSTGDSLILAGGVEDEHRAIIHNQSVTLFLVDTAS